MALSPAERSQRAVLAKFDTAPALIRSIAWEVGSIEKAWQVYKEGVRTREDAWRWLGAVRDGRGRKATAAGRK